MRTGAFLSRGMALPRLTLAHSAAATVTDRPLNGGLWRFMIVTASGNLRLVQGRGRVQVLHLGGGGAGARGPGGGGSAGQLRGFQAGDEFEIELGTGETIFPVTIGAGAARQTASASNGLSGGDTVAFGRTAVGGGGGSRDNASPGIEPGGGAAPGATAGSHQPGGTAPSPVGYAGGQAYSNATSANRAGGGGAGTSGAGGAAAFQDAGEGGLATDLGAWLGLPDYWVGEGGGGWQNTGPATAPLHGGGQGGTNADQSIDATTPGSGGGGSNASYGSAGFRGELLLKWRIG